MSVFDWIRTNRAPVAGRPGLFLLSLFLLTGCGPAPVRVDESAPAGAPAVVTPANASAATATVESLPAASDTVPSESPSEEMASSDTGINESVEPSPSEQAPQEETEGQSAASSDDSAVVDETDLESRPETPDDPEDDQSARYEFRDLHDPDGIGKFYLGREIAWVMGFAAAPWLERPEREKEEATSKLLKALELKREMIVADIGAGSGVLTLPISKRVLPRGKVYAVDVQQEMLDRLSARARSQNIRNIELVLGTEKSPRLKKESIDLALMVDVYHEFAFPYEMMREISKAMKTGGRVVFVEFRMEDRNVPIKLVHKMTEEQVKKEIGLPEFRLKWKETIGTLPWQHVIVFEKQGEETNSEKAPARE